MDDMRLSESEIEDIFRTLVAKGAPPLVGGARSERFTISVTPRLKERLGWLQQSLGWSLSEAAAFAALIGVAEIESELRGGPVASDQ